MGYQVQPLKIFDDNEVKTIISSASATVKVEVNFVFRGTVLPVQILPLSAKTQELFSKNIQLPILSPAELYGSKLVAAMDRQHPRDIFDVQKMYENHGLTAEIMHCFVAYLVGHNRPMHETLYAKQKPMEETFKNEFVGMPVEPVSLEQLVNTQTKLIAELPNALTQNHRSFLLSFAQATPDWSLLPFKHLQEMPAIQWKLQNLKKLRATNAKKFQFQHDELERNFIK